MERTGLWDIKGSEGSIFAAFKIRSGEGISGDKMWLEHWIQTCLVTFLPPYPGFRTRSESE